VHFSLLSNPRRSAASNSLTYLTTACRTMVQYLFMKLILEKGSGCSQLGKDREAIYVSGGSNEQHPGVWRRDKNCLDD
jgi:hypothetical protein